MVYDSSMGITASQLSIIRSGRTLLERVDFCLSPGDALFVKGPNGSGKTSLLRAIAGLGCLEGDLEIDPDNTIYAGHLDAVKPALTGLENLHFWTEVYGLSKLPETLAPLNLEPLFDLEVKTLSAGQRKRLGLARVLISGTQNWLLDEPITALDQATIKIVENLVATHRKNGGCVILSSHQPITLPKAKNLDLLKFKPKEVHLNDPFLEGRF